ncbi:uncharacterized protein LOC127788406 isoform X2 [Diospyros lotus]|uniref:uncharacterized protein LOC127788406 isoform X2 n=1 Tax=Diospyros lotus TaxID=55363 RepID=UPI00224DA30A|nr:uncharacterized protein LOC127788406 isoform X2 [Diospyros lotus]
MSFQNTGFWMAKGTGCLNDGDMAYDNSSRIEPKRSHQWFMDGNETELFPNKKQAVEVPSHTSFSGFLNSNVSISPWGNTSGLNSTIGQVTERLFDPETARASNFDDGNIPSVGTDNDHVGRKAIEDSFGSDSPFGLSMCHTFEDPRSGLSYGGIRKVKVSQVKDCENFMSVSMGLAYNGDNGTVSTPHAYGKTDDNSISMGLSFNRDNANIISIADAYNRVDDNFISMGQSYVKGDDSTLSMGHVHKGSNNAISMSQSFSKGDGNISTMGETFNRQDDNNIPMGNSFKDSICEPLSKADNLFPSMGQTYRKGDSNSMSLGSLYNKLEDNAKPMGHTFDKVENSALSIGHSFGKGNSNIISFGGQDDDDINSSGRLICSYDLLMDQSSTQRPEALSEKCFVESNVNAIVSATKITSSMSETVSKEDQKASKKVHSNNFPSNVRSLLSTGMLDGVPVKYIAWSREELRGIIKGSGYLCGCHLCNFSKAINAYEFERHACCKTKHPNNHIYFENGKTIYGIVQELRNTPQDLLFEVIQTITGSSINQKAFRLWKESFLAATRELQRIYGKDEGKQFS